MKKDYTVEITGEGMKALYGLVHSMHAQNPNDREFEFSLRIRRLPEKKPVRGKKVKAKA